MSLGDDLKVFRDTKKLYHKGRFQYWGEYRFNKWFFRSVIGVLIFLFVVAFAQMSFSFGDKIYYKCPIDVVGGFCMNPFYKACLYEPCPFVDVVYPVYPDEFESISNLSLLPAGFEIGEKPSFLFENFVFIVVVLIGSALLLNHLIYNRGFRL